MKKIGIVTITGGLNLGNSLQNYALQVFLRRLGYDPYTLLDRRYCLWYPFRWSDFLRVHPIKRTLALAFNIRNFRTHLFNLLSRQDGYLRFNQHLSFAQSHFVGNQFIQAPGEVFDAFIAGSDQIWNPYYDQPDYMFLTFAPKEKRVSYAASFGSDDMPECMSTRYQKLLSDMNVISVREAAGKRIVSELIGRDVPVLADPTLLLDDADWRAVAKSPHWFSGKSYILTYFLGERSAQLNHVLERRAKSENVEIIHILDKDHPNWYGIGPSEFLYLIANAKAVYTDSFHGTVFSILLRTPFIVCDRVEKGLNAMGSRLDTLLGRFAFASRRRNLALGYDADDLYEMDFSTVEEKLSEERARSAAYLQDALG